MQSVDDLLKDVSSETNAIAACDKGLSAIGAFVEDIMLKLDSDDIDGAKAQVKNLQDLNTGLVEAVSANVTPESAGSVGKSRAQQALEAAEATVRDHFAQLAQIVQNVSTAGEHLRAASQAIAEAKAINS